jgi:hypothetical protein
VSGLRELLALHGLNLNARIKVVRHQDKRRDLPELEMDTERFEEWQKYQSRAIFDCDYIVSFIGLKKSRARFYGVYRVGERVPASTRPSEFAGQGNWYCELERVPGFNDLRGQLVIEWDGVATSWHRWLDEAHDKKVVEIVLED